MQRHVSEDPSSSQRERVLGLVLLHPLSGGLVQSAVPRAGRRCLRPWLLSLEALTASKVTSSTLKRVGNEVQSSVLDWIAGA